MTDGEAKAVREADGQEWCERWVNLAQPRLGAGIVAASDEFFAPAERLLDPRPPIFVPDKFDDHGKWMDGWETRRRRGPGHDVCVIRLGAPGIVHGIEIDTRHFTGNYAPAAALEACFSASEPVADSAWRQLVPTLDLQGDARRFIAVASPEPCTHLRLHIYPDGGIARLRVYGEMRAPAAALSAGQEIDLAALRHGGRIVACNDAHFGSPWNLLAPGSGVNMGDGWETRRRREPGHDWVIVALGCAGLVERIEVDTAHFKGNYPERCSLQGALVAPGEDRTLVAQSQFWPELLGPSLLQADAQHEFPVAAGAAVNHVKFNILPDGGVSRLRVYGRAQGESP